QRRAEQRQRAATRGLCARGSENVSGAHFYFLLPRYAIGSLAFGGMELVGAARLCARMASRILSSLSAPEALLPSPRALTTSASMTYSPCDNCAGTVSDCP